MLSLAPEQAEQAMLKEYIGRLKRILTMSKKKRVVITDNKKDFFPFKKKLHYFADQCLEQLGEVRPEINLHVGREDFAYFVDYTNRAFRAKYAKLRAETVHREVGDLRQRGHLKKSPPKISKSQTSLPK